VVPRASALVRGMPVLEAQSSMPFTLLEKRMMGGAESDMVGGAGGMRGEGKGGEGEEDRVKGEVLEDEREAPSS
jgi:hypothetical protein